MTGRLLTARVVAQQLGLSTETILSYQRNGTLPAYRLPSGAIRFDENEIAEWLEQRRTAPRRGVVDHPLNAARNGRLQSISSTTITDEED